MIIDFSRGEAASRHRSAAMLCHEGQRVRHPRTFGFAAGVARGEMRALGKGQLLDVRTELPQRCRESRALRNQVWKVPRAVRDQKRWRRGEEARERTRARFAGSVRSEKAGSHAQARASAELEHRRNGQATAN